MIGEMTFEDGSIWGMVSFAVVKNPTAGTQ